LLALSLVGGLVFVISASGFADWAHNHSLGPEGTDAVTAFLLGVAPFEAGIIAGVVLPKLTAPVTRRTALRCLAAGLWIADGINVALVFFFVGQGAAF
jgi:hypothetical protein